MMHQNDDFLSNFGLLGSSRGCVALSTQKRIPEYPYMGQFLQDGKNVRFMSLFFKKWMARAAKPSDIDDFFRFAVTYHDFGMPLK